MSDAIKTRQIIELLKCRHSPPEWASFVELRNGTGASYSHSMDFFAFNTYPSKRFLKVGYEIKVSRGDFAHELENPLKRQWMMEVCDECYFAAPAGLLKPDEIPENWGLVETVANGLRMKKRAQQRHITELPMSFIASLTRRSAGDEPSLPAAFWMLAGKEVSEHDLVAVADEAVQSSVKSIVREAKLEERRRVEGSGHYARMNALYSTVSRVIGFEYTDATRFEEWIKSGDRIGLGMRSIRALRNAQQAIDKILKDHDKQESQ